MPMNRRVITLYLHQNNYFLCTIYLEQLLLYYNIKPDCYIAFNYILHGNRILFFFHAQDDMMVFENTISFIQVNV